MSRSDLLLKILGIIAWPGVAVFAICFICLVFKQNVKEFFGRLKRVSKEGIDLEREERTNQQALPQSEPLIAALPKPQDPDSHFIRTAHIAAAWVEDSLWAEQVKFVITMLSELPNPELRESESKELLALSSITIQMEQDYRIIYGSQLGLLEFLNGTGPKHISNAKVIFEAGREANKEFYQSTSFDEWLKFLIERVLVQFDEKGETEISITPKGKSLLRYLIYRGYPIRKLF